MKLNFNQSVKVSLITFLCMISFLTMHSQNTKPITGTVKDSDQIPVPGVNVFVKGTSTGTVTDFDGNYQLDVSNNQKLTFSNLGYKTQTIAVGSKTTINVTLETDTSVLDEVVVVGYGQQKKKEITGAVAQVDNEELSKSATADVASALQGQIAGVNVQASSGEPGAEANIQIRGLTSVFGNNRPLYVVDGIPFEGDPKLSVSEVETIDVLKDAASAAIYGTRGAAGVILITTKKAKKGLMQVNVEGYSGIQSITSGTPLLNREEYLYTKFLTGAALQDTYYGNTWTEVEQNPNAITRDTDLMEVVLNDFALTQNYSVRVAGGKEDLAYNVSANYYDQEGSIINSSFDRLNVRSNTQYTKGKLKIDTGISFRVEHQEFAPWGLLSDAISYNPLRPEVDPDAELVADAGDGNAAAQMSTLGYKLIQQDNLENNYFDGYISATYSLAKNLNLTTRYSGSFNNGTRITINPQFLAYDLDGNEVSNQRSKIKNLSTLTKKNTWENILNYKKTFGNHSINLTGVYSLEKYSYSEFFGEKYDILNNDITVLNGATSDPNAGSGTNQWTQDRESTLIGMLARAQYNYKGKYILSASVRRDGSSRFQQEHWGVFPSFSAGWVVSDENFWEPIKKTFTSFKIRASQGTTGNQGIPDYSYTANIVLDRDYVFGLDGDQNLALGAIQEDFANKNVKWETSVSTNFGVDMGFFRNKLTLSADVYNTDKKDMLFPVLLPPTAGAGQGGDVILNVGDMTNQGLELALGYKSAGKFSWDANITYSRNINEITKMSGTNKLLYFNDSTVSGHTNDSDKVSALAEGYEAGAFFLWQTDGIISNDDELAAYQEIVPTAKIGDLRYIDALTIDTNGDGIPDVGDGEINLEDRQYAGSGTPEFEMGFNFNAFYANFDFSMQWYASYGSEIINGNKALAYKSNTHRDLVYQWSPQNETSHIPVFRNAVHDNLRGATDLWLQDGSFVRLRNIALGYTIPKETTQKMGISKFRIYLSAQNPLTITDYDGYDPEVGNNGLSTRGIDKGTYPVTRLTMLGVQFDF
ncbi:TonB-dependent receptor [Formosa agariphila KMM 3901]|uniref:TonB-dependent receptor n=1 Tax=Formosa agariphila (strain DSM 15362 / KCTC 12365 / LMG 23005 / KMM 3901 / M-2Alg 35-1) TaxID=1347342 RepID=T2KPE7_FORAG|nr:TonB-dependent receptor [Formosa agariphila]CDF79854.1 TonB-dependent receptor [Formosa agariphila KMM 3901]